MKMVLRVALGVLIAAGLATAASAQTKWDMPTPYPDGNFHTKNVIQFAADVDKATNGSLQITTLSRTSRAAPMIDCLFLIDACAGQPITP